MPTKCPGGECGVKSPEPRADLELEGRNLRPLSPPLPADLRSVMRAVVPVPARALARALALSAATLMLFVLAGASAFAATLPSGGETLAGGESESIPVFASSPGAAAKSAVPAGSGPCEQPPSVAGGPVCARGETFGGQPADVLVTFAIPTTAARAAACQALAPGGARSNFGGSEQGPSANVVRLQLAPGAGMPASVACPGVAPGSEGVVPVTAAIATEGGISADPIDPRYLLGLGFGSTSFWIQPWRAYMDTWPASRLLDALGVNFNISRNDEAVAQVLAESGYKLARITIPWSAFDYSDPTRLRPTPEAAVRAKLVALHTHGLRPLILLDANSEYPVPYEPMKLETLAPAPAGARTVQLSRASAAAVIPGRSGFSELRFSGAADEMITSVTANGTATLALPLPAPLPAGKHGGAILRYAPFEAPTLPDGRTNPSFAATLDGWLQYTAAVSKLAASVVGPGAYDLEVWNEMSFGSQFLNAENYFGPSRRPPTGMTAGQLKLLNTLAVAKKLLSSTVAYVRDPANGISPQVGITDGFASESPFPSGAQAPIGLTALSKHPYASARTYPADYTRFTNRPLNALGRLDATARVDNIFAPLFIPQLQTAMPEYFLTGLLTETTIRDVAPMTNYVYGYPHGRSVGPPGGAPVQKWITEYNLDVPRGTTGMTQADREHFHAKALLRSLVANVSKGFSREYFYAASAGPFSVIGESFFAALEANPSSYPGVHAAGPMLLAMRNMLSHFQGPGPEGPARQLTLQSIVQSGNHAQFQGDGTPAHPSLFDREVLAVLPFQSAPRRFVIPFYVMTSDLATLYDPAAPSNDVRRYDLPAEAFRITLGNLPETSAAPTVSAFDPLTGESTPARLVSRAGASAIFEVAASDYPRLLQIEYQ